MSKMTQLLTEEEAAAVLNISPRQLAAMRRSGRIAYLRLVRSIRYKRKHLEDFIATCEVRAQERPMPRLICWGAGIHSDSNYRALAGIV